MTEQKKPSVVKLVPGPDGEISFEPWENDEPDPQPGPDGKYYLECTIKGADLAFRLIEQGVEVYCAICKAPLKGTRAYVLCPTSEDHFRVVT